jgi:hypothetical protein
MGRSTLTPRALLVCLLGLTLLPRVLGLYFYLGAGETRCFIEELPQDTIVVGQCPSFPQLPFAFSTCDMLQGHYKAEEWSEETNSHIINDELGIQVIVEASRLVPAHTSRVLTVQNRKSKRGNRSSIHARLLKASSPSPRTNPATTASVYGQSESDVVSDIPWSH